jgi:hypothetical protein
MLAAVRVTAPDAAGAGLMAAVPGDFWVQALNTHAAIAPIHHTGIFMA